MIKINLLVEARADKVARAPMVSLGTTNLNTYILLAALILAAGWVGLRYWQLSSRLTDVNNQVAENRREYERLKPIIAEVEAFKKRNAELRHKIEVIEQLKANQFGPVRLMDEVSKALPDLLWLTDLGVNGSTVIMRGQALNENAVANFIANLGASPFFSEPVLKIMQQNEQGVFGFDLSCIFTHTPRDAAEASAPRT